MARLLLSYSERKAAHRSINPCVVRSASNGRRPHAPYPLGIDLRTRHRRFPNATENSYYPHVRTSCASHSRYKLPRPRAGSSSCRSRTHDVRPRYQRAADLLISQHGAGAVSQRTRLARRMLDRGDSQGRQVWARTRLAVETLQAPRPGAPHWAVSRTGSTHPASEADVPHRSPRIAMEPRCAARGPRRRPNRQAER